ncbi:hypothetical protein MPTK1_3g02140 [Marchantia polymorpha subsp. ruderalis]|uniref:PUB 62/63 C-terminal domain-containing protein n=2 Tax=Marchantia polymorpha TaxID=3197 RepID=A0AAF6AWJ3_MARPO|nr:hypothetical protein MARPO_0007s0203 [Marchantia polymorpha]BBN04125.1 hypothetical protein Mp_3g02140 [Marchantia polymorpha subsp. ruderalis]PTQ47824.1 hypothetical protein MARPO_0007s0203 [Marchantia polymorpha]PTQ47827.1 hypothetical protein MARPO_0007s0203 [Marchantia polymorpha]BBN04126.1 hypothetical protein Mp_3g02140 [Marchantia polymorpha subsp. ruderalis]|eukprot:PTQ47811.1 hypothetical protein MARPO_0007s0203 [Marchantia polymorpha]
MEPVCLFQDDQDHGHVGSGLKLRSFINEGLHNPPEQRQHHVSAAGDASALSKVDLMKNNCDADILLASDDPAESGREDGKLVDHSACSGGAAGGSHVLVSAEINALVGHQCNGDDLDDIDSTDMCFDGCVITSGSKSHSSRQEPRLGYGDTYLESLSDRDGMLIESVPASSPASFFQSDTIHVSKDKSLVGQTELWRNIRSSQQESGYHTSSTEFDPRVEQAADSTYPKEGIKSSLSSDETSIEHVVVKDTPFNSIPPPGQADSEKCQSSKGPVENDIHPEQKTMTHGSLPKEKVPLVDLSLRRVLCDPITGSFLEDAMVAQCGHSFGGGCLKQVMDTHLCITCGATISPNFLVPNFALRAAVLAYKHEDQLQMISVRGIKRRREENQQFEGSEAKRTERVILQGHWGSVETTSTDNSRFKAVQFPFAVNDKVLIKGNKRTPERFVGREAIITSQCLNGWYLVKTLDTGDSVRLQYRSLEKLGDTEMPYTSAMEYFSDQCGDGSGSPFDLPQSTPKSSIDTEPESGSAASQRDAANGILSHHGLETNISVAGSSERDFVRLPYSSSTPIDVCGGSNSISGVLTKASGEVLPGSQLRKVEHRIGSSEDGPMISENARDPLSNLERCSADAGQSVSDAMVEKFRTDLLNGISTFHDESGDEQMAQDGSQSDTSAKLWDGAKIDFLDTHTLNGEQVLPSKILSTDTGRNGSENEAPTGNKDQENEIELLRTRSKRSFLHSRISLSTGVCGQDTDPYRKVYSSGYRRRGGKGDNGTVTVENIHAEGKSSELELESIKSHSEDIQGAVSGGGKHGRDLKLKSTKEIRQIMKKDVLKLEKQIPRSYLLNSWRSDRISWRKCVRTSCTVVELAHLLREFRYALLLTDPGGMTDEEWEKRLATINESGDVDLLVSLWGRLYDDVYKCVETKSRSGFNLEAESAWRKLLAFDAKYIHDLDFSFGGQPISPGQMTTANVTADSTVDCDMSSRLEVKTLLASTMNLLQKQSRKELLSVKEALEREKRHIIAKLAKLEDSYVKLVSTPPIENFSTGGEGSNGQPSQTIPAVPSNNNFGSGGPSLPCAPDEDTDDGESVRASPSQDADGEATDMSDSD